METNDWISLGKYTVVINYGHKDNLYDSVDLMDDTFEIRKGIFLSLH